LENTSYNERLNGVKLFRIQNRILSFELISVCEYLQQDQILIRSFSV